MFVAQEIIRRKRDGAELSVHEIQFFINGFVSGAIPDYQMAAFAMAVYFKGLSDLEVSTLLHTMISSGKKFDWSRYKGQRRFVDKHSTGGVGDKTSIVLLPLLVADGFDVPMIAGRGLGHTGGTVDKLESIPGFKLQVDMETIEKWIDKEHGAFGVQSEELVPADKRFYALRDVTATVENIGLITASIMSKKIAENLDGLVLDVKYGSGAFMQRYEDAFALARSLVKAGYHSGCRTIAAITNMDEPLGRAAGNALEMAECLDLLSGAGPRDTRELTLRLAAGAVAAAEKDTSDEAMERIYRRMANHLDSGRAYEIFCRVATMQGARLEDIERRNTEWITGNAEIVPVPALQSGIIKHIDTREVGMAIVELGGGRKRKEDVINPYVGLTQLKKPGEEVAAGEPLCFMHVAPGGEPRGIAHRIQRAYECGASSNDVRTEPLIKEWLK